VARLFDGTISHEESGNPTAPTSLISIAGFEEDEYVLEHMITPFGELELNQKSSSSRRPSASM
jgi:hypothetical protein